MHAFIHATKLISAETQKHLSIYLASYVLCMYVCVYVCNVGTVCTYLSNLSNLSIYIPPKPHIGRPMLLRTLQTLPGRWESRMSWFRLSHNDSFLGSVPLRAFLNIRGPLVRSKLEGPVFLEAPRFVFLLIRLVRNSRHLPSFRVSHAAPLRFYMDQSMPPEGKHKYTII